MGLGMKNKKIKYYAKFHIFSIEYFNKYIYEIIGL